jgi:predicted RNase H-like nuclease (RuvC/YqgF family)
MEFLKVLFNNGALSFADFVKACQDAKINLVDLSKGDYISKNKYNDEIQANKTTIEQLQQTIKDRDKDIKDIKKRLGEASTDADKLTKLQADLDSLQTKYTTDTQAFETRLSKQAYEFAVKEFAGTQKFTSKAAKREFINSMIAEGLKMKGDTIIGADDFVKSYATENEDSFVKEEKNPEPKNPTPKFADATGNQEPPKPNNPNQFNFSFMGVRPHN